MAEAKAPRERLRRAQKAPRRTFHTRVALVAHDRHLTEKQLGKFRKKYGRGTSFDFVAFAETYDISIDWLIDGELRKHLVTPRIPKQEPEVAMLQEFRAALEKTDRGQLEFLLAYCPPDRKKQRGCGMTAIEQIASDLDDIQTPIARARHLARAIRMMATGDEMHAEPGDATWTVANSLLEILDEVEETRVEIWRLALSEKKAPRPTGKTSVTRCA